MPHPQIVTLAGSGHDVFDSDYTGCVDRAIGPVLPRQAVGDPCRRRSVARGWHWCRRARWRASRRCRGCRVVRGRVLRAALSTVADAAASDNEAYYAGFDDTSGGGLRGGMYDSVSSAAGRCSSCAASSTSPAST